MFYSIHKVSSTMNYFWTTVLVKHAAKVYCMKQHKNLETEANSVQGKSQGLILTQEGHIHGQYAEKAD